jgi:hypothetical protein
MLYSNFFAVQIGGLLDILVECHSTSQNEWFTLSSLRILHSLLPATLSDKVKKKDIQRHFLEILSAFVVQFKGKKALTSSTEFKRGWRVTFQFATLLLSLKEVILFSKYPELYR